MRRKVVQGGVTVQAIVGTRAAFFGFDLDAARRQDCLGFAIHRIDHDAVPLEQYWLSSFKTFASVVPQPVASQKYSTFDHPVQSFYWGDYTLEPGHHYTYRIVPRYGTAKNLTTKPGVEVTVDVTAQDPNTGTHGVYFNRGVAASQAYVAKFGAPPDQLPPPKDAAALAWLSRGLLEVIVGFIGQADSNQWALRAAVYEFTQTDVLAAFKTAHDNGADVHVVYHSVNDAQGPVNDEAVKKAGLPASMVTARTNATIAHNKFIVLCRKTAAGLDPVAVWTGSTNISEGGIFGHSNVGHAVRDPAVAAQYLEYWTELQGDPDVPTLRDWVRPHSPFDPATLTASPAIHTLFSPRHGNAPLAWYAKRFADAQVVSHITLPFGMSTDFETPLNADTGTALHYVLLDKADNNQAQWGARPQVLIAVGAVGGPDELATWATESLTGFNSWVKYIHTKILLVDPLSADPTVITGSANFSPDSTSNNDENMLIINGDTDVADVYISEYARIFQHFYARYWAAELTAANGPTTTTSFLDETSAWQTPYFAPGNRKSLVRELFSTNVEANT